MDLLKSGGMAADVEPPVTEFVGNRWNAPAHSVQRIVDLGQRLEESLGIASQACNHYHLIGNLAEEVRQSHCSV